MSRRGLVATLAMLAVVLVTGVAWGQTTAPPVQGLGQVGGFKLYVEDRAGLGFEELYQQVQGAMAAGYRDPQLTGLFSSFQVSVPQIDAHVDRERAKTYGVALTDVFETLQVYLGSLYVNDFNAPARAAYHRVGLRDVNTFMSVMF